MVAVTRSGRSRSVHVRWHAPWGQEFSSVPGSAGFQVVLQGSCWLLPPHTEPVQLIEGDVVFLPHGTGHTLANSPERLMTAAACGPDDHEPYNAYASDSVDRSGDGGPVTVVLCGAYQLDPSRSHPLLLTLPDLIRLPAHPHRHPENHTVQARALHAYLHWRNQNARHPGRPATHPKRERHPLGRQTTTSRSLISQARQTIRPGHSTSLAATCPDGHARGAKTAAGHGRHPVWRRPASLR